MATEIIVKNERVWVKIEHDADAFTFSIGYHGNTKSFKAARYPIEWISTTKEAKEFAQVWLNDYK